MLACERLLPSPERQILDVAIERLESCRGLPQFAAGIMPVLTQVATISATLIAAAS